MNVDTKKEFVKLIHGPPLPLYHTLQIYTYITLWLVFEVDIFIFANIRKKIFILINLARHFIVLLHIFSFTLRVWQAKELYYVSPYPIPILHVTFIFPCDVARML